MQDSPKYDFQWSSLGDIRLGRPNLGLTTRVEVYRLMQYTMRTVLEKRLGLETAASIFFDSGYIAGCEFCKNILDIKLELDLFIIEMHQKFVQLGIGILHIESCCPEKMSFTLTVSEDLDCSGLPVSGDTVCEYDEGFLSGIFHIYTGKEFSVKEIDCWATGGRTCRFTVVQKE